MVTVDTLISEHYPGLQQKKLYSVLGRPILRRMLHEDAFTEFSQKFPHLTGIEFVEQALQSCNFQYLVTDRERENIPTQGRIMIIANHPVGSLDGLALLKLVHEVRPDIKIVANELLMAFTPLRQFLLPVKVFGGQSRRDYLRRIQDALRHEEAVIIFPAGEVSRLSPLGIRDGQWQQGFLKLAMKCKAPILPIHVQGRNSAAFYLASLALRPLSTLMLVGEMFRQKDKQIKFTVGSVIPHAAYNQLPIRRKEKVRLFKRHLYRIGAGKKPIFVTESAIARPERKADLKKSVQQGELLGKTPDGKALYLLSSTESSPVMREVGRLRELTFRAVGEGTGNRRDLDNFDTYYQHLIIWDEDDLEIAGAYRFVGSREVLAAKGAQGLYSGSLFKLDPVTCPFLHDGLELGRSFVQQRYWGKRSLDYLWYGIGAYLSRHPEYRYLFGPVTISNSFPPLAKDLLVHFYRLYFPAPQTMGALSITPYQFSHPAHQLHGYFSGDNYRKDFQRLKTILANLGCGVPTLYKQYTELCEPGGAAFLDFNVDPAFGNCIDGLVIIDTSRIKAAKRDRYLQANILLGPIAAAGTPPPES